MLDVHETLVSPLRQNGILHSNPTAKAEILNQQFQSVFRDDQSSQETNLYNSTLPEMPDIKITETGVLKLLQNLKPYKAQGPDNIHPRILKELAVEIAPSLTLIFRKSYETGEVPKDLVKSKCLTYLQTWPKIPRFKSQTHLLDMYSIHINRTYLS